MASNPTAAAIDGWFPHDGDAVVQQRACCGRYRGCMAARCTNW